MISLGALECTSSCIMTALSLFGLNPQHFLLAYWDINYHRGNLLSSRNPYYHDLRPFYGIQKSYEEQETLEPILASIRQGHLIMLRCQASDLSFFPRELLSHDAAGFDHYCLLTQYDEVSQVFHVVDPIASHIGVITIEELVKASMAGGKLYYYEIDRPSDPFHCPTNASLFRIGAEMNYRSVFHNDVSGLRAFDQFANELELSAQWDVAERDSWLRANTITVSSTIKLRKLVWDSYTALHVLEPVLHASLASSVKAIVSNWTRLNLSLIKYKQKQDTQLISNCQQVLFRLRELEKQFLLDLREAGLSLETKIG